MGGGSVTPPARPAACVLLTDSPRPMPFRTLLIAALALGATACDSYDDDFDDDTSLQVFVVDLEFDDNDYEVNEADQKTATFYSRDARVLSGTLDDALQTAGDGDLVMLYIDSELVSAVDGADNGTWAALPLTRGFDEVVVGDTDGDGETDGDVIITGLLASYEYSFDNGNLYFDVVSSLPYTDFTTDPDDYFPTILPARFEEAPDDITLRLVVIPDELFATNGAGARVDLRDYEAVRQAYGLPE